MHIVKPLVVVASVAFATDVLANQDEVAAACAGQGGSCYVNPPFGMSTQTQRDEPSPQVPSEPLICTGAEYLSYAITLMGPFVAPYVTVSVPLGLVGIAAGTIAIAC